MDCEDFLPEYLALANRTHPPGSPENAAFLLDLVKKRDAVVRERKRIVHDMRQLEAKYRDEQAVLKAREAELAKQCRHEWEQPPYCKRSCRVCGLFQDNEVRGYDG